MPIRIELVAFYIITFAVLVAFSWPTASDMFHKTDRVSAASPQQTFNTERFAG